MTSTRHLQISVVIFIIVCSLEHSAKADTTECYEMANGADYRGSMHTTADGQTCQKWTSRTPHVPYVTPEKYPDTGLGDHNFCRNPDGDSTAWCYTTDPDIQWNYCDIGSSEVSCGSQPNSEVMLVGGSNNNDGSVAGSGECYEQINGADYRGSINTVSMTGDTCAKWTSFGNYNINSYPDSGFGDHNFCRNPFGAPTVWCYIAFDASSSSSVSWGYCDIGSPGEHCSSQPNSEVMLDGGSNNNDGSVAGSGECYYEMDGADYRGSIHTTTTGVTCRMWLESSFDPDAGVADHNFCRNPDGDIIAWCLIPQGTGNTNWGYCDIGNPGEHCSAVR